MKTTRIAAAAAVAATTVLAQSPTTGIEQPTQVPQLNVPTIQGCFSSSGTLVFNSTPQYNTIGECGQKICQVMGKAVGATTGGNQCWCGDEYPPLSSLTDDSKCNVGCSGYNTQACGGINYWTVYNTGLNLSVPYSDSSSSSAAGSSSTATVSGSVYIITQTSTASPGSSSGSSSTNTAGIAAGVVVGVVVIAGIAGGLFFWMRRRRNAEIEEEHRRNAAVNAFIGGQKPPSSSGGFSVSDSRLDPVMAQRRLSSGSIADNQDYSRKILRVTNA